MAITTIIPTPALPTASTGLIGSPAASSSAPAPGSTATDMANQAAETATSVAVGILAAAALATSDPVGSDPLLKTTIAAGTSNAATADAAAVAAAGARD